MARPASWATWILRACGWTVSATVPDYKKYVICVAPHTSNWDFIMGELAYLSLGRRAGFLMKKDWFFFPLGCFFKAIGGIPVERSRHTDMVEQVALRFDEADSLAIAITPEATRKPNKEWKRGFYYIARRAGVPIVLAYIDYGKKRIGIDREFTPTDDVEADMNEIKRYYMQFEGKNKDNFITGLE